MRYDFQQKKTLFSIQDIFTYRIQYLDSFQLDLIN